MHTEKISSKVLTPVLFLDLSIGTVQVNELSAMDALDLLDLVAGEILSVAKQIIPQLKEAQASGNQFETVPFIMQELTKGITGCKKAAIFLVQKSVRDQADLLSTITSTDFMKILSVSFKVTFNDDLIAAAKSFSSSVLNMLAPATKH